MRCALTLAYNGTHYLGSQVQTQTPNTIFGNLERVLKQLGINSRPIASGRTDKGVHATGQVCHVDLPTFWTDLVKLKHVLNEMLPPSIKVNNTKYVTNDFHARYSAKKRVYRYVLKEGLSNPFEEEFVTFIKKIDFHSLEKNVKLFIGEHNFKNFMKTGSDVNSTQRIIYKAYAYKYQNYIVINIQANGFLRSQIRLMVGALLQLSKEKIIEQLECKNTHKIRPAPSNGLYLAKVTY